MATYTLTVLDVTGIQSYIFGSNRLAENIGASQLVEQATTTWVRESLPTGRHNLLDDADVSIDSSRFLESDTVLDAEVILRGGGNVLILFRTLNLAKQVVVKLTDRLLTDAPGLELAVAHHEFAWDTAFGGPEGAHKALFRQLNQSKQQRRPSAPLPGLAVTLECRSTGLPAVGFAPSQGADDTTLRPASAEVLAKLKQREGADARFKRMFEAVAAGYTFRREFDALGGTEGEMAYIAVVHADGNGMGSRFKDLVLSYPEPVQNRACLNAMRALSGAVDQAGRAALKATIRRMTEHFKHDDSKEMQGFLNGIRDTRTGEVRIPFRPIVYGGDDVTFVCDGRLGLALARIYLEEWERATQQEQTLGRAYACAGVAVVKAHYPFVRAYELAEQLCKGTKASLREMRRHDPRRGDASALDWHFAMSGIGGTLKEIRSREYTTLKGEPLYLRPVSLAADVFDPAWYSWKAFDRVTRTFQSDPYWRERRNKVKALREVLRDGSDAVEKFKQDFVLRDLPTLDSSRPQLQEKGWDGARCGYFDAIEALDFYLPLTEEA